MRERIFRVISVIDGVSDIKVVVVIKRVVFLFKGKPKKGELLCQQDYRVGSTYIVRLVFGGKISIIQGTSHVHEDFENVLIVLDIVRII